jgi:type I restriction enzyme S subunit
MCDTVLPGISVNEQRRIADFLDDQVTRIDSIIAARERQIGGIDEARLASIQHRLRSLGSRSTWLPLRRFLCSILTGSTPSPESNSDCDGLAWYTPASIDANGQLGDPIRRIGTDTLRSEGLVRFPAESVLLVGIGATAGRVAMLEHPASGNQQLTALVANKRMDKSFLYHQLLARRRELLETAPFTTLPILNNETILGFPVCAPPVPTQVSVAHDWESESRRAADALAVIHASTRLLQEFKRSLISAAVSGEFDVSTASGRGVPA